MQVWKNKLKTDTKHAILVHISETAEFREKKNGMKITNTIQNLGNTIKYTHTHITFTVL